MDEPPPGSGLVAPPADLAAAVAPWVQALQAAAGDAFRAAYLHGSALTPRFDPARSDINLLLVVSDLPFARLETLAHAVRELAAKPGRRVSPLVLTESQLRTSVDVFPAEFLDLVARRALVAGTDPIAAITVTRDNLRHQCEYELRSKLVGLRQAYLLAGGAPGVAQRLLVQAAGGLAAVLRNLLALSGTAPPDDADALVGAVAREFGLEAVELGAPFAARREKSADEGRDAARFAAYLQALEALVAAVDAYPAR